MSADKLDIFNRALGRISAASIASVDEKSMSAKYCRLFYPQIVRNALEGPHEWSWAIQRVSLAEAATNDRPYEWRFAYLLPSNLGSPIRVLPDLSTGGIAVPEPEQWEHFLEVMAVKYVIEGDRLYCNEANAILEFTVADIVGLRVSSLVVTAIETQLASLLAASPVKKDSALAQKLAPVADLAWQTAIADDRNRQPEEWGEYIPDSMAARHDMCPRWFNGNRSRKPTTSPVTTPVVTPPPPTVSAPINASLPAISGTTQQGQTLSVTTGTWDSYDSLVYQWQRNGANISGANASAYVLQAADVGTSVTCVVTATRVGGGNTPATSLPVGPILPLAPSNTVAPAISGIPQVGNTLACSTGTWVNGVDTYQYQWKLNGSPISGATSATLALVNADLDGTITCDVKATNAGGNNTASATSVGPVVGAPVNTVAPVVSGSGVVGSALACSTGTWAGVPTSFAYQWRKDGVAIAGATTSSYTPVSGDVGANISCSVVGINSIGPSSPAISNSIGPIISSAISVGTIDFYRSSYPGGDWTPGMNPASFYLTTPNDGTVTAGYCWYRLRADDDSAFGSSTVGPWIQITETDAANLAEGNGLVYGLGYSGSGSTNFQGQFGRGDGSSDPASITATSAWFGLTGANTYITDTLNPLSTASIASYPNPIPVLTDDTTSTHHVNNVAFGDAASSTWAIVVNPTSNQAGTLFTLTPSAGGSVKTGAQKAAGTYADTQNWNVWAVSLNAGENANYNVNLAEAGLSLTRPAFFTLKGNPTPVYHTEVNDETTNPVTLPTLPVGPGQIGVWVGYAFDLSGGQTNTGTGTLLAQGAASNQTILYQITDNTQQPKVSHFSSGQPFRFVGLVFNG